MQTRHAHKSRALEDPMEALDRELSRLLMRYGSCLQQVSMAGNVKSLKTWIAEYREGAVASGDYLYRYGMDLLDNLSSDLKQAEAETKGIGSGKRYSSLKAQRLARAASATANAKNHLQSNYQPQPTEKIQ